ncbi:MAG: GGDEF domain-containing protein [Pseudomonadota bacterium]
MVQRSDTQLRDTEAHTAISRAEDMASIAGTSAPYLSIVHPRDAILSFELSHGGLVLGRGLDCDVQLPAGVISRHHCRVSCVGQSIVVEDLASTNGTFVDGQRIDRAFLTPSNQLRIGPFLLKLEYKGLMEIEAQNQLLKAARLDPVTGIANRGWLVAQAARLVAGLDHPESSLTAVMVDIDRFKSINDHHGHAAGDAVLRGVAEVLEAEKHAAHLLGRYGGEEFVLLMGDIERQEAFILCDRMREQIARKSFELEDGSISVQVSIGIACRTQGELTSLDALISAADAAMYRAKRQGRDRVCS